MEEQRDREMQEAQPPEPMDGQPEQAVDRLLDQVLHPGPSEEIKQMGEEMRKKAYEAHLDKMNDLASRARKAREDITRALEKVNKNKGIRRQQENPVMRQAEEISRENRDHKAELERKQREQEELSGKLQEQSNKNAELAERGKSMEKAIARLRVEMSDLQQKYNANKLKLGAVIEQLDAEKRRGEEANRQAAELRGQIESIRRAPPTEPVTQETEVDKRLQARIDELEFQLGGMEMESDARKEDVAEAFNKMKEYAKAVEQKAFSLQAKLQQELAKKLRMQEPDPRHVQMEQQLRMLQEENQKLRTEVDSAKTEDLGLPARLAQQEEEIKRLRESNAKMEASMMGEKTEDVSLPGRLAQHEQENMALKQRINELEGHLSGHENLKLERDDLLARLRERERDFRRTDDFLMESHSELDDMEKELHGFKHPEKASIEEQQAHQAFRETLERANRLQDELTKARSELAEADKARAEATKLNEDLATTGYKLFSEIQARKALEENSAELQQKFEEERKNAVMIHQKFEEEKAEKENLLDLLKKSHAQLDDMEKEKEHLRDLLKKSHAMLDDMDNELHGTKHPEKASLEEQEMHRKFKATNERVNKLEDQLKKEQERNKSLEAQLQMGTTIKQIEEKSSKTEPSQFERRKLKVGKTPEEKAHRHKLAKKAVKRAYKRKSTENEQAPREKTVKNPEESAYKKKKP
jgi:chromosome segregation ATPase